jgi:flagellar biosynthesis/type III secretory pathway protein FliH
LSNKSFLVTGQSKAKTLAAKLPELSAMQDIPSPENRGRSTEAIKRAREEATKKGFEQGFQTGHSEGIVQGRKEGRDQGWAMIQQETALERKRALQDFTAELQRLRDKLQAEIEEWYRASEERMTDLATVAVREILTAELNLSRESALGIVKQALAEVTHSTHARIRLNPFDSAILQNHRTELLAASRSLREIDFVDDPLIAGGCIVETDGGLVDASLETKLELLESAIRENAA